VVLSADGTNFCSWCSMGTHNNDVLCNFGAFDSKPWNQDGNTIDNKISDGLAGSAIR